MCANCGKGEDISGDLKACTACNLVKYCNRECQIAHRPQHKKACKKRAAELRDEALFKEHPPEECPICCLPLPVYDDHTGVTFHSCCGKLICNGCVDAMDESGENGHLCAFCRSPPSDSDEDEVSFTKKLMDTGNAEAINHLAANYAAGRIGLPQDMATANELYLKAGELGHAGAYFNLGTSYALGRSVDIDRKKEIYYYKLAAISGELKARHNLGFLEGEDGNYHRAYKHFMIGAMAGYKDSLDNVKCGYMKGLVTKEQYAITLREYQKSQDSMRSDARDKALAHRNRTHHG